MIVLDTHAVVWWTQQPELLGANAVTALDHSERIAIPAIVFWETALLVRKGRLALKRRQSVAEWAAAVLSIPRVDAVPLSPELGIEADGLDMHPDLADRFIVATALQLHAALATKDALLVELPWLDTLW